MTFELRCRPYTLKLRDRFTLANSTRTTTPTLLVELEREGIVGRGEAAMPPYLGETQASARAFLEGVDLAVLEDPFATRRALAAVDARSPLDHAAKAALDLALHDWQGQRLGQPHWRIQGIDRDATPPTSFTLGIDEPDALGARAAEASTDFRSLKVKLGGPRDRAAILAIRRATDVPLRVDVNQGWRDKRAALAEARWLADQGVELIEQPLPVEAREAQAWLRARSPLPLYADEGVQRLDDVQGAQGLYDGVNVKLMKCTGLLEARDMIVTARALGLHVMLGCMTETSCAIAAAAQLAGLCDVVDLDGALLVANDPFEPMPLVDGRVLPNAEPGLGVALRRE